MRGGCFWTENMSSISCVQGNSGLIGGGGGISHLHTTTTATTGVTAISPTLGGGSYNTEPLASVRPLITTVTPQSPAQGWHMHPVTTIPSMKEEIIERDERIGNDSGISSAYTPGSDGFHSSSPEGSDHNSRDSEPAPIYSLNGALDPSTPLNFYNSTPVSNAGTNFPTNMQLYQHAYNNLHYDNSANLMDAKMPLKTNNNNNITDKHVESLHADLRSPDHSESDDSEQYYKHGDGDDSSLHRLEIAMDRSDLLSGNASPKGSEHNSLEDDKSDYEGEEDEASLRTPRVNSHGKVKIFKCKQCEYVAVTKLDFWEHTRSHIKVEKLLTCPKCPFVTEYKHHLEYHLRNHFGSKPFKCDKCNYSCVNKSMLNSHLKSHSNVYQYRCSDCAYATKYCHSLKLHLRKYNHKPAMVLNPDGSPNPLPIIDVYGTRRGPKQRGSKGDDSNSLPPESPPLNVQQQSQPQPPTTALQHSMFPTHFMFPPNQSPVTVPPHFSFGQLLTAFQGNMPNPLMFPQNNNNNDKPDIVMETSTSPIIAAVEKPQTPPLFACKQCEFTAESQNALDSHTDEVHIVPKEEIIDPEEEVPINGALDLSSRPVDSDTNETVPPMPTTPTTTKNRRKGRAFKLGHVALQLQHATGSDDEVDQSSKKQKVNDSLDACDEELVTSESEPATVSVNTVTEEKKPDEEVKKDTTFNCQYCDIVFKDVVMYTMHMGYHGWKDPFTCNMCGEETEDKVAFFLHIARTSHC